MLSAFAAVTAVALPVLSALQGRSDRCTQEVDAAQETLRTAAAAAVEANSGVMGYFSPVDVPEIPSSQLAWEDCFWKA